jgi:deoxyribonuclease-4
MPLFGAHMSIAGGHHNALLAAQSLGCDAVQLFTKSTNQWRAKPLSDDDIRLFRRTRRLTRIRHTVAHDSYLINLASSDEALYRRSIESFIEEFTRTERLGIRYLVTHPGAHLEAGEEVGLRRVAAAFDEVQRRCPNFRARILLETTAGQGSSLGYRFEHLARILSLVSDSRPYGICMDTCHVFAAGYALSPKAEYEATMREFQKLIGTSRLKVFHMNDSAKPWGSRVDRHAHIGKGSIGLEAFRLLVNDPRFQNRAMILETPKESSDGTNLDAMNLGVLRGLLRRKR